MIAGPAGFGLAKGTERPLRVLMTTDAVGGVWQYALDLADGLAAQGVQTTLAVVGPPPSDDQAAAARTVPGLGVTHLGLKPDWMIEADAGMAEAGAALEALARASRADLVHLNAPAFGPWADFRVPVVGACHSCVATWWRAVKQGPLPPEFAWRTRQVAAGYDAAQALIAPTRAFADDTAGTYGIRQPDVVWNGRRAHAAPSRGSPAPFAFTAGRLWDQGKNVRRLDRAAARLSLPVQAAGPVQGPQGEFLPLQAIERLGVLTDAALREQLHHRPIFVSAGWYEPFGLAVLEAAQAGCALVLSDIPTFRELWDGAAAFVPADEDDAVLASEMEALARDPGRRAALGRAARERSRRYTVAAMTEGVMSVYRTVLAGRETEAAA
ncbi:MAG TPA: glycosyltransferase family 4 protein [Caulobacteraceae bacterium]|jgi:glycosyltransferase involved in cell wall biosynthesis